MKHQNTTARSLTWDRVPNQSCYLQSCQLFSIMWGGGRLVVSYKTQSTVTRTQSELMLKENQYENVTCVHVFRRITEKTFSVSVLGCKGSAAHAAHKCCSNDPKTLTHPKPTDANRGKETHRHCRHSLLLHVSSCLLQMLFFFILYFFYSLF